MILWGGARQRFRSGANPLKAAGTDLIKFFVRIRGVRTLPPRMDAPVIQMPLHRVDGQRGFSVKRGEGKGKRGVPSCACDAEADVEPHSCEGPDIRAGLFEERARVELGP